MLRAWGFRDGDFSRTHLRRGHAFDMNPSCRIQPLVDRAMSALEAAGAKPRCSAPHVTTARHWYEARNTPGFADVIAYCIETSVNGQRWRRDEFAEVRQEHEGGMMAMAP